MQSATSSREDATDISKGHLAKEKMIRAALDVFGEMGFDGATTRMLAQHANMNLGAIPYYFGSKEDLYTQAAEFLSRYIETQQNPSLKKLLHLTSQTDDREKLCDAVVDFLIVQAQSFLSEGIPVSWMLFFLKAQHTDGPALDALNQRVIEPAQRALVPIIARILNRAQDDPATLTLTFLGIHQALYIRLADAMVIKHMKWPEITPDRMSPLLETIRIAIRAQLLGYPRT